MQNLSKMPIFCVKSVKIYTGQKKFTRVYSWLSWQIWGMSEIWSRSNAFTVDCWILFLTLPLFVSEKIRHVHQIFVKPELHTSDSLVEILRFPYLVFIESHNITFQWQGAFLVGKYIEGQSNCDDHPCIRSISTCSVLSINKTNLPIPICASKTHFHAFHASAIEPVNMVKYLLAPQVL